MAKKSANQKLKNGGHLLTDTAGQPILCCQCGAVIFSRCRYGADRSASALPGSSARSVRPEAEQMSDLEPKTTGVTSHDSPTVIETRTVSILSSQAVRNSLECLDLKNRLKIRLILCYFLTSTLAFCVASCFALILLKAYGYETSDSFLQWLGGVTIAQVALLLGVFVQAVWQQENQTHSKSSNNRPAA